MADNKERCDCTMITELDRMREDIKDGKAVNIATAKNVSDIRDSNMKIEFLMTQTTKTQNEMALVNIKIQNDMAVANIKNQDAMTAGFKAIADKEEAKEKSDIEKKEKADETEAKDKKDRAKEKRQNRWMVAIFFITYVIGSVLTVIKQFIPALFK